MITHLHIQNFKCLRDVQVDLVPFTILIGPNDSGKSSLLDAVQALGMSEPTANSVPGSVPRPYLGQEGRSRDQLEHQRQGRAGPVRL